MHRSRGRRGARAGLGGARVYLREGGGEMEGATRRDRRWEGIAGRVQDFAT